MAKNRHLQDVISWAMLPLFSISIYSMSFWSPLFFIHSAGTAHNTAKGHSATKHCSSSVPHYAGCGLLLRTLKPGKNHSRTSLSNVASKDWDARIGRVFCFSPREYYSYRLLNFSRTTSAVSKWEQQFLATALATGRCSCWKYEPKPNVYNAHHQTSCYLLLLPLLQKPSAY